MATSFTQIIVLLLIYQPTLSINIDCHSTESSKSTASAGATISVSCSSPYTLVSCGFRADEAAENDIRGSWISGQTCWAENGSPSDGVYAVARCCDLSAYGVTCHTKKSAKSGSNDGNRIDISCASTETLMGCTAHTDGERMDGSYPGNANDDPWALAGSTVSSPDSCTGWNAEVGIYAYATCCESSDNKVTFECEAVWSAASTVTQISFGCNSPQQFMTSCSAADGERDMNKWKISDQDGECKARTTHVECSNCDSLGIAICCTVVTSSPTPSPTSNPTPAPTQQPTPAPTSDPTKNPTPAPTNNPTLPPSNQPTSSPSKYPTHNPTLIPTNIPSKLPTKNPAFKPSKFPTKSPVQDGEIVDDKITTETPIEQTESAKNSGNNGIKGSLLGTDPILDYLLYAVIGLILIICILSFIMLIMSKKHKNKNKEIIKDENDNGVELHKIASLSSAETGEMNSDGINGESENTLPNPPQRMNNMNMNLLIDMENVTMIPPVPSEDNNGVTKGGYIEQNSAENDKQYINENNEGTDSENGSDDDGLYKHGSTNNANVTKNGTDQ